MSEKANNAGKTALVLEGGSFRGQFTAGVLDVFLENGIAVDACYGVSAGALNGVNFKSKQIGRCNRLNLAFCGDSRYVGTKSFAESGSIQDHIDPFDNETFKANPLELYVTVTDVVFGTADYLPIKDSTLDLDAVRASTSLPLVTPVVELNGHLYLDGGIADSVPVEHVLEDAGFDRAIVILTQDRNYKKGSYEFMPAANARYAEYPYLLDAIATRHDRHRARKARHRQAH